eukprot:CAMPEP_0175970172 /NCGR_PEP_ID=MMETSP0108-20121206/40895_1 /TAXON_ID=195067 ORGANISM="Goniomonas pacifica, Strain CCMP1869" /NCGR_SAMPLE_ID=MMETSP0108 /ASSEMBLY_ACC=CAM_ASM_000204 /LENGTH=74 /DNA_ID=CAMNT_0017299087 /DNA_START=15 /DNA_END=235 /DNA_ORIENTATION=+
MHSVHHPGAVARRRNPRRDGARGGVEGKLEPLGGDVGVGVAVESHDEAVARDKHGVDDGRVGGAESFYLGTRAA